MKIEPLIPFPKSASPISIWYRHIKSKKLFYLLGTLGVIGTNLTEVLIPKLLQWLLDFFAQNPIPQYFIGKTKFTTLTYFFILFMILLIIQGGMRFIWRLYLGRETHRAAAILKNALWNKASTYPLKRIYSDLNHGNLMNHGASDISQARYIFGFTIVGSVDIIFLSLFSLVFMAYIDWILTLASLGVLLALPVLVKRVAHRFDALYKESQNALSDLNEKASQSVATIKMQRLTQSGDFWKNTLNNTAQAYRKIKLTASIYSLRFLLTSGSAPVLSNIILFSISIYRARQGELTAGEFIAMQTYIFKLRHPLEEIGFMASEWQRSLTSLRRLAYLLHEEEDPIIHFRKREVQQSHNCFEVKNLSFSYDKSPLLSNVSFSLEQGNRLGITGKIGSGKSTLINILSAMEREYDGIVQFRNYDIREYNHQSLSKVLITVPQKTFLFATTIAENLQTGTPLTHDEMWHFLELAEMAEHVHKLQNKLDTGLGEWGINLSGGQKQRLTLARSLAKKPEVLLLDDCLSAVDTVTEEKILNNLDNHLKNTTLVWTAHRMSTLKHCDRVIEL